LKTLKVIDTIPVNGIKPDAIVYDPFSDQIFAFNGKSKNCSIVDPAAWKLVATLELGGKPEFAVTDFKGSIYVNLEDAGVTLRINSKNLTIENTFPLPKGEEPASLAIDVEKSLLYVGCAEKKIYVLDAKTGLISDTLANGEDVDALVFDKKSGRLFSSNEDGTVYIYKCLSPQNHQLVQKLITQKGAKTMGYNPFNQHIYIPTGIVLSDGKSLEKGSAEILIYSLK
jgi:hypothetical protein